MSGAEEEVEQGEDDANNDGVSQCKRALELLLRVTSNTEVPPPTVAKADLTKMLRALFVLASGTVAELAEPITIPSTDAFPSSSSSAAAAAPVPAARTVVATPPSQYTQASLPGSMQASLVPIETSSVFDRLSGFLLRGLKDYVSFLGMERSSTRGGDVQMIGQVVTSMFSQLTPDQGIQQAWQDILKLYREKTQLQKFIVDMALAFAQFPGRAPSQRDFDDIHVVYFNKLASMIGDDSRPVKSSSTNQKKYQELLISHGLLPTTDPTTLSAWIDPANYLKMLVKAVRILQYQLQQQPQARIPEGDKGRDRVFFWPPNTDKPCPTGLVVVFTMMLMIDAFVAAKDRVIQKPVAITAASFKINEFAPICSYATLVMGLLALGSDDFNFTQTTMAPLLARMLELRKNPELILKIDVHTPGKGPQKVQVFATCSPYVICDGKGMRDSGGRDGKYMAVSFLFL